MTGIITTFPPVTELPPGSASGPANLPPVTYQYAVLGLAQTWTGVQTFAFGMFQLAGSISGVTALQPQAVAGGILSFPNGPDTLVGKATTDVLTNKTYDTAGAGNVFNVNGTKLVSLGATLTISGTALQTTALTGDVTAPANSFATTIAANAVTNAKAAQMAANTIKGNNTGSTANAADLTVTQVQALLSGWNNTRLPKTANYPVVNADKGSTIALSGGFFTLTFTAISGGNYDANFVVAVVNEDTGAGKTISVGGGTSYILWPGQTVFFFNSNSVWKSTGPYRFRGSNTVFVDPVNGNDANDGLAAGTGRAFQHIQNALTTIQAQWDLNGGNPVMNLANGTYNESFTLFGGFFGGLEVTITGNAASPSSVVWNGTLACRDGGTLALNGIKFTSSGSQCLLVGQMFVVDMQNMEWGACASGVHIQVDPGGYVNFVGGTYVVSAAAVFHIQLTGSGAKLSIPASQTISVPSALTFTTWLYNQSGNINFGSGVTFTGTGAGAGSTGKKWDTNYNGVTLLSGCTTVPGATAGVPAIGVTGATGGQVA